jgi:hypothetical protein
MHSPTPLGLYTDRDVAQGAIQVNSKPSQLQPIVSALPINDQLKSVRLSHGCRLQQAGTERMRLHCADSVIDVDA